MILSKFFYKQSYEGKLDFKNKKILELGTGTGIVSFFLAGLGIF